MTKRLSFVIFYSLLAFAAQAKTMVEIWSLMPDSIIPYIDRTHRLEMTDFIRMGLQGDVANSLSGKSQMDTITTDYIHLTLNETTDMELKRLPYNGGDSLLCLVTTFKGPEPESKVRFFTQEWQTINLPQAFDGKGLSDLAARLFVRPDTMSQEHFAETCAMVDPVMLGARLSAADSNMTVSLSAPLLQASDRQRVTTVTKPLTLRWDGSGFKAE